MSYRFPGMDPYLEAPNIWRGFHHSLAEEIRARLNESMGVKYYADVEVYTTFEEIHIGKPKAVVPDVAVLAPTPETPSAPMPVAISVAEPVAIEAPIRRAVATVPVKLRSVRRVYSI